MGVTVLLETQIKTYLKFFLIITKNYFQNITFKFLMILVFFLSQQNFIDRKKVIKTRQVSFEYKAPNFILSQNTITIN